jgi:hypothetical protein
VLPVPRVFALLLAAVFCMPVAAASPRGSGQALETAMVAVLREHGFDVHDLGNPDSIEIGDNPAPRRAWRNVRYTTIYGHGGTIDFVLDAPAFAKPVWVEAMRQQTRGSLDERLPYLLSNARLAFPDVHVVLVLEGPGWRPGALAWALRRAAEIDDKQVEVMGLEMFRHWLTRRLAGE